MMILIKKIKCLLFKNTLCKNTEYLDIGKVDTVEVIEHLVNLRRVLKHCTSCLGQVIERRVSSQSLGKGTYSGNLYRTN